MSMQLLYKCDMCRKVTDSENMTVFTQYHLIKINGVSDNDFDREYLVCESCLTKIKKLIRKGE